MGKTSNIYNWNKVRMQQLAGKYPVANIRVFGPGMRGNDGKTNDIHFLVDALPEATLLDLGWLANDLQ
jgi:predicted nucleotidyltransferase